MGVKMCLSKLDTEENKNYFNSLNPVFSYPLDINFFCCADKNKLYASGLYRILNKKNGVFYLGAASIFLERLKYHKNHLAINIHDNILLQDDYNIYGVNNFVFDVLKVSSSTSDYLKILEEESKILLFCRKKNVHIYNIYIKPFHLIKNNKNAIFLSKERTKKRFEKNGKSLFQMGG